MAKKILAKFRVKPEADKADYVTVRVFDSQKNMHNYGAKALGIHAEHFAAVAYSHCLTHFDKKTKKWTRKPDFGGILFSLECLDFNVVVHEATHIAFRFSERMKFNPRYKNGTTNASASEERFCYIVGNMSTDIASQLVKRKLIK